jgi:hypothetical protein
MMIYFNDNEDLEKVVSLAWALKKPKP